MKKIISEWKWGILGGLAILLLALFLRLYNLTLLPVFVDEAIYIRWSQIMINESTLRFIPLSDGKQPLFMWATMGALKLFSDPLFAGRFISVLAGVGTLVGVFAVSYYLFKSPKVALIASFIYALSPFAVFFDRLALVDSLLSFFGIWTFFFALVTFETRRLDMAMITGFILGLAALTKSPALFFAVLLPAVAIFTIKKPLHLIKLAGLFTVIYLIAFAMYNILRLGPNFHLLSLRNFDYVYPYSHFLERPLDPFKGHMGGIWNYFILLLPLPVFFLALGGIVVNFRLNFKKIALLTIWGIFPILVIAEYSKVVTARYIFFVLPFIFILAASAFLTKEKWTMKLVILTLLGFGVFSIFFNWKLLTKPEEAGLPHGERNGYLEEWTAGQGIVEIANFVKEEHVKNPTKKIVVGTEGYFGTLPNGLEMYLEGVENVVVIGVGLGIREIPTSLKESKEAGNKTYLVVNQSRLSENPDNMGLKLISSYPKPLRKVGSKEYSEKGPQETLFFFEVK
ncbi:hypothetical protein A2361_01670 [Candidatus Woesebacteria bacterium RIFOXYB1_FULL_40_26]|uniref:Glycosyltransferase RgtA/B/C/D-like domain-containing protein n=1 Tax=Candidatus Woesebacteria bacterium RIFOXYB1_FULL_40_26 TaxID=1802539 RepID=A0A1F8CW19_9BACT|nr:MAG: hypothetical protein A2361_01670 [Candidatus Woesebacteria bacterium RIFOXYB1_FULL_40_26]